MKNKEHLENHTASHRTVTCKKCKKEISKNSRTSHSCLQQSEEFDVEPKQQSNLKRHLKVHITKKPKEKKILS